MIHMTHEPTLRDMTTETVDRFTRKIKDDRGYLERAVARPEYRSCVRELAERTLRDLPLLESHRAGYGAAIDLADIFPACEELGTHRGTASLYLALRVIDLALTTPKAVPEHAIATVCDYAALARTKIEAIGTHYRA